MRTSLTLFSGALALGIALSSLRADPPAASPPQPLPPGTTLPSPESLAPPHAPDPVLTPSHAPDPVVLPPHAPDPGHLPPPHWETACDQPLAGPDAGASFYYLKPFIQNNTAFTTTIAPGTPAAAAVPGVTFSEFNSTQFRWQYDPAAAVWAGWTTPCGLGIRARYFRFDQTSDTAGLVNGTNEGSIPAVNPPLANVLPFLVTGGTTPGSPSSVLTAAPPGVAPFGMDQITIGSDLKINVFDLEATYVWESARFSLLASAGARYVSLDQDYRFAQINLGGGLPVTDLQLLNVGRKFAGVGPLVGLQGNLKLGRTGLSLFACARGALLVGTTNEHYAFFEAQIDPTGLIPPGIPGTLLSNFQGNRTSDNVLPVVELELGVQYALRLRRCQPFVRAAIVDHTYFDAGNSTSAAGNLSLFGGQFALGVNY